VWFYEDFTQVAEGAGDCCTRLLSSCDYRQETDGMMLPTCLCEGRNGGGEPAAWDRNPRAFLEGQTVTGKSSPGPIWANWRRSHVRCDNK
jgi:hypothetical protein